MSASLRFLVAAAASLSALTAFAQTIQYFTLMKSQDSVQTDASTVTAMPYNPAMDLFPAQFEAEINGTALDPTHPAPPNHVTTPAGTVTGFDLAAPDGSHGWQYRSGFTSKSAMDSALASGTYAVSLANGAATTFNLGLTGDSYPNTPFATLTGGTWAGNVYEIDPANAWTLNTGTYSTNFLFSNARIEIDIWGGGIDFNKSAGAASGHPYSASDTHASLDLDSSEPPTFLAGNTYVVDIRFSRIIDYQDISGDIGQDVGSAFGVSMYESMLSFSVQAVPEPSAYAALAGVLSLGFVAWRRWRAA